MNWMLDSLNFFWADKLQNRSGLLSPKFSKLWSDFGISKGTLFNHSNDKK